MIIKKIYILKYFFFKYISKPKNVTITKQKIFVNIKTNLGLLNKSRLSYY